MNAFATRAGLLAALAVAALAGCKQEVMCPALASCGGPRDPITGHSQPPLGAWTLRPGHPSCMEDLYIPANDPRLGGSGASILSSGKAFPEPAVFDWCVLLATGPVEGAIQVRQPRFYYESGQVGKATVSYDAGGGWKAEITRTGTATLDFPSYCVRAFGALDGRQATDETGTLTGPPVDICKQLEVPVKASGEGEGSYFNTVCTVNPADPPGNAGCLCTFNITETGGPPGTFYLEDDQTIVHILDSNFPQKATFCQQGDRLQLTGTDGAYLFDQRGLRTFDLVKLCTLDTDCASGHCDVPNNNCI
jgi:hypothetical protein